MNDYKYDEGETLNITIDEKNRTMEEEDYEKEGFLFPAFVEILSSDNDNKYKMNYLAECFRINALTPEHLDYILEINLLQLILSEEYRLENGEILLFLNTINNLTYFPNIINFYLEYDTETIVSLIEVLMQAVQGIDVKTEEFEVLINICQKLVEEPALHDDDSLKGLTAEILSKLSESDEYKAHTRFIKNLLISNNFMNILEMNGDLLNQLIHQTEYDDICLILLHELLNGFISFVIQSYDNKETFLKQIGTSFIEESKLENLTSDCLIQIIDLIYEIFNIDSTTTTALAILFTDQSQIPKIQSDQLNDFITDKWLKRLGNFYSDVITLTYIGNSIDKELHPTIIKNSHKIVQKMTELLYTLSRRNLTQIIFSHKIIKLLYYIYKDGNYAERITIIKIIRSILSEPECAKFAFRYFFNHNFVDFLLDTLSFDEDDGCDLLEYVPKNEVGSAAYDALFLMKTYLSDAGFDSRSGFFRRISRLTTPLHEWNEEEEAEDEDNGIFDEVDLGEEEEASAPHEFVDA